MTHLGLSTPTVIANGAVVLIQAGLFHKVATFVPNSFAFDNVAPHRQQFAVRTEISLERATVFIPDQLRLGESRRPSYRPSYKLALRAEERSFDEIPMAIVRNVRQAGPMFGEVTS